MSDQLKSNLSLKYIGCHSAGKVCVALLFSVIPLHVNWCDPRVSPKWDVVMVSFLYVLWKIEEMSFATEVQGGKTVLKVFCLQDIYSSLLRCCLPINTGICLQIQPQITAALSPLIARCLRTTNYWRCALHVKSFPPQPDSVPAFGDMLIWIYCSVFFCPLHNYPTSVLIEQLKHLAQ